MGCVESCYCGALGNNRVNPEKAQESVTSILGYFKAINASMTSILK